MKPILVEVLFCTSSRVYIESLRKKARCRNDYTKSISINPKVASFCIIKIGLRKNYKINYDIK